MASSSPPRDAIKNKALPGAHSTDGSLSNSLSDALAFLETLRDAGLGPAPLMPEPEAIEAAARAAGISPEKALIAYLTILNHEA